jgi:hypothetical protein
MDRRTKRVWLGLVNYANGAATDAQVWSTVADCMGWVSAVASYGILGWIGDNSLPGEVAKYRPSVDVLLRFLCSGPKSEERKSLRFGATRFLREHGRHIAGIHLEEVSYNEKFLQHFNFSSAELENFKKQSYKIWESAQYQRRGEKGLTGKDLLPLGINVPTKDYQDLADPICDFLMAEYQRYLDQYLNKEYSSKSIASRNKRPGRVVPILICPGCNKLVMPERIGRRQYCSACSDRARAEKYREKASPDENRDYQWLYRLRSLTPDVRRIRLRIPKSRERLQEIKIRQRNSTRCQRLIVAIKL